jgi:hypothetical protein
MCVQGKGAPFVALLSEVRTALSSFLPTPPHAERGTLSLLSNTLRGVALAASGISGSLGHGVAFLSLDTDYIRDRQHRASQARATRAPSALTVLADDVWRGVVVPLQGT